MRQAVITIGTKTGNDIKFPIPVGDGKSSFELWLQLPGNEGKTMEDFQGAVKGKDGNSITSVEITRVEE